MQTYKGKTVSPSTAAAAVRSGDNVYIGVFNPYPAAVVKALIARRDELTDVQLFDVPCPHPSVDYFQELLAIPASEQHIRTITGFTTLPAQRQLIRACRGDQIPVHFSDIPALLDQKRARIDVALVEASPPDNAGYFSFGIGAGYTRAMIDNARTVIVEVNDQCPRLLGDCMVHIDEVDYLVEHSKPQPIVPDVPPSELDTRIAEHIDPLVMDESTVQLGFGGIPNAVAHCFAHKKGLGVHTEMIVDAYMHLFETGAVTNRHKAFARGKFVATFASGTQDLYDWMNNNGSIEMRPVSQTNDPFVIAQNPNVVAINSVIMVDLTGQATCESIGPVQYTGSGGQVDFTRGASRSDGGKAILVTYASGKKNLEMYEVAPTLAQGDRVSRIVPQLPPGAIVSTPRNDVDWVVTEYGAVSLKGKPRRQRAELLISIADPLFQPLLEDEARRLHLLG
ncbi:MAG: acetyl-CoA hydrolase/transferase family protein [Actinobacteria bacterium]|nr:acetyl-CoA hydrolase/transferase family protein [Actinomycetota bacterium]